MQGDGASTTELGFVEMQVLVERLREEKHQLSCRNLVLEEQCRNWKRSFEEEGELIVKLREEVAKLASREERLVEKNRKLREEFESEEKRLCEEMQMVRERYLQLDVSKRRLEVDLEAARKEMKKMEAAIADMDEKDRRIVSLIRENEGLQMAKRKIEEEWRSRILKLKKDLTEQIVSSLTSSEAKIDLENSGQKPIVVLHLDSPKELEADIQSRAKPVSSEDTSRKIKDDAEHSPAVALPSNVETHKHLKVDTSRMIQGDAKHSTAVTVPSKAETPKLLKVDTGREIQDGAKHSPAVTVPSKAETPKHLKVDTGREIQGGAKHSPAVTVPSKAETPKHLKVDTGREIQDGAKHSPAVTVPSKAETPKHLKVDTGRKIQDGAKHSPAVTFPSSAETQKHLTVDTSRKIQDGAKHSPAVTFPSNAETQKHLTVDTSRKIQDGAKRSPVVTVPSNAETHKRLKVDPSRKIQDGAKHSPAATVPSNAETQKCLKVAQGRELGDRSIEMQGGTKCCKSSGVPDGKLWKDSNKMFIAFTGNDELCMKSVCALYRKHMSLGPWKNALTQSGNGGGFGPAFHHLIRYPVPINMARGGFEPAFNTRVIALGELLTGGDPEGKMKKKKDELERENPTILKECRDICRCHCKELFEIYEYNLDPLFVP